MLYMIAFLNDVENMHLEGLHQRYQTWCNISTPTEKRKGKKHSYVWRKHVHLVNPSNCNVHMLIFFFTSFLATPLTLLYLGHQILGYSLVKGYRSKVL